MGASRPSTAWTRLRPAILKSIVGAVVAAAAVAIYAVIVGSFGVLELKLILVIVVFVAFTLFALFDAEAVAPRHDRLAIASLAVAVYLLVAGVLLIALAAPTGQLDDGTEGTLAAFARWIALALVGRGVLLELLLLEAAHRHFGARMITRVAAGTSVAAVLTATLLSIPAFPWTDDTFPAPYWRSTGVAAILMLLGTALLPLLGRFFVHRDGGPIPASAEPLPPRLAWPRLEDGTPLPAGPDGRPDYGVLTPERPTRP